MKIGKYKVKPQLLILFLLFIGTVVFSFLAVFSKNNNFFSFASSKNTLIYRPTPPSTCPYEVRLTFGRQCRQEGFYQRAGYKCTKNQAIYKNLPGYSCKSVEDWVKQAKENCKCPQDMSCVINTTPASPSGPIPLTIKFDGTKSSDPSGSTLTYNWGIYTSDRVSLATKTGPTIAYTFTNPGAYVATLRLINANKISKECEIIIQATEPTTAFKDNQPINILLLGIDRRTPEESYRTDTIIIASISADRNTLSLTSIPRDLAIDGVKINELVYTKGIESLKDVLLKITGVKIDRYLLGDYDAFVELIDTFGGVEVDVERAFTDTKYPNDREGKSNLITISFKPGLQKMDGETALKYVRSRSGSNGENTDFARMKRSQKLLLSMPPVVFKGIYSLQALGGYKKIFEEVAARVITDFNTADAVYIYPILNQYDLMMVKTLVLDTTYLAFRTNNLNQSILVATDNTFNQIKQAVSANLGLIQQPNIGSSQPSTVTLSPNCVIKMTPENPLTYPRTRSTLFDGTQSTDPGGSTLSYSWVLLRGSRTMVKSTKPNFTYRFSYTGSYTLKLSVKNAQNSISSCEKTFNVR